MPVTIRQSPKIEVVAAPERRPPLLVPALAGDFERAVRRHEQAVEAKANDFITERESGLSAYDFGTKFGKARSDGRWLWG